MGARLAQQNDEYIQSGADSEVYSDFLHAFLPHPNTGQITRRTNVDAVKQSIRNIVLTNKYERLRNPTFGGNIRRYLFEPFTATTSAELEQEIRETIERYEPRADIDQIEVTPNEDNNSIAVSIVFYVVMERDAQRVDLTLYRVR